MKLSMITTTATMKSVFCLLAFVGLCSSASIRMGGNRVQFGGLRANDYIEFSVRPRNLTDDVRIRFKTSGQTVAGCDGLEVRLYTYDQSTLLRTLCGTAALKAYSNGSGGHSGYHVTVRAGATARSITFKTMASAAHGVNWSLGTTQIG